MIRDDLATRLLDLDRSVDGIRAALGDDSHAVEEIVSLGEEIAADAGAQAGWVEDQVTLILAKHGLLETPPAGDEEG
ncbi:MAG TPA: hypothetical protein VD865_17185 [Stenotrophomonas sp.]|nr:hypothetical protein [Stenotrophomonas sp.]